MDDSTLEFCHGITSILSPTNPTAPPLRRTLSADMSSSNWVPRDEGQIPPKGPPDHLPHIHDEDEGERFEIWNSIQEDKRKAMSKDRLQGGWGSTVSRNEFRRSESETLTLPPQYVHPLVRRSTSCLSERSLEICTESLGSETGSDGFSMSETRCLFGPKEEEGGKDESFFSSAFSRTHDVDAERSPHAPAAATRNKQGPRSFPPPLPSLSPAADGASLRMQSRRENGRLVLEAVSVPSQKNFQARRENGRLVLAVTTPDVKPSARDQSTTEGEEEEVGAGVELIIRKKKLKIPKITIMMNKSEDGSKVVFFNEGEVEINSLAAAEGTSPRNVYEYLLMTAGRDTQEEEEVVKKEVQIVFRSSKNMVEHCWVSVMNRSRRRRSSLFFLGPRCIATS